MRDDADYCLSCGRPMDLDFKIYERGDLSYDNIRFIWSCGPRSVSLTRGQALFVEILMRRGIANRSTLFLHFPESENAASLISVQMSNVRKSFAKLHSRMRIKTRWAVGYELVDSTTWTPETHQ